MKLSAAYFEFSEKIGPSRPLDQQEETPVAQPADKLQHRLKTVLSQRRTARTFVASALHFKSRLLLNQRIDGVAELLLDVALARLALLQFPDERRNRDKRRSGRR